MALTPEDVVNKRFQPTKFREGYDQDEVDDFLDEIVVELRRLNQENDELRRRVAESDSGEGAETAAVPAPVAAAPAGKVEEKTEGKSDAKADKKATVEEKAEKPAAKADAAPAADAKPAESTPASTGTASAAAPTAGAAAPAAAAPAAQGGSAESAAGVLAMAQRLHDEYVSEGNQKRDKIIAEAQTQAKTLVEEAEEKSRQTLNALEVQKTELEQKVDSLRTFERDYRGRLKAYIEGQLRELDAKGSSAPDSLDNA
ncbi:DivIVA domain-containing protein [Zhihengliuella salsuginis]|uniref:Cell wall synthesis protein Wag31 n=1 Tax=Zhihengliuella salsuginis TaxID=578222 RepID=A0ABQ3GDB0_9MICC|nr:DivIVA domain-containing protein [Zhihengliuella salsuginis]GHD00990.1 cell division protein DivIVA [Zhihengliuella salsuginis]